MLRRTQCKDRMKVKMFRCKRVKANKLFKGEING